MNSYDLFFFFFKAIVFENRLVVLNIISAYKRFKDNLTFLNFLLRASSDSILVIKSFSIFCILESCFLELSGL